MKRNKPPRPLVGRRRNNKLKAKIESEFVFCAKCNAYHQIQFKGNIVSDKGFLNLKLGCGYIIRMKTNKPNPKPDEAVQMAG